MVGKSGAGKTMIKWKIRITRRPQAGDKFASRFSQKGVAGLIVNPEDMPFNDDGMSPDIIVNPHGMPSRMTIGTVIEAMTGKAGALLGEKMNGTAYRDVDQATLGKILGMFGYSSNGTEHYTDGTTGEPLVAQVFVGPMYYQVLKHMVEEKRHARARGDVHHLYRQPPEGRSRDGGLRLGEMERDALIAHGARGWLKERYCTVSDAAVLSLCERCGVQCIGNAKDNYYVCDICGEDKEVVTVEAPTSFRLLTQYNAAMGIKMAVKTGAIKE